MEKKQVLCEGKSKLVYETENEELCIVQFKDEATAFNGLKKGVISGKGVLNNKISAILMRVLADAGVPTHFVKELSDRESLVKRVDIIPIEIIVRNVAAGSLVKRVGLPEGVKMRKTVLEYCYKNDALGDPMINTYHVLAMEFASEQELKFISETALKINSILSQFLLEANIELIDFKIEFGKTVNGQIVLADEISPDTSRFWDVHTHEKLDKDRFRKDLGNVEWAYNEVYSRLLAVQNKKVGN